MGTLFVCKICLHYVRWWLVTSDGYTWASVLLSLVLYSWAFLASRHSWCFIFGGPVNLAEMESRHKQYLWGLGRVCAFFPDALIEVESHTCQTSLFE